MREKYESLSVTVLKDLAKARGIKGVSAMKKGELVERMLEEDERVKEKEKKNNVYSPRDSARQVPTSDREILL